MLEVAATDAQRYAFVREAAEKALKAVPGVDKAQVVLTAAAKASGPTVARRSAHLAHDPQSDPSRIPPPEALPHVKRVIAVASGKGGVGKSTVSVNLALAFVGLGLKVGLLDADIYGPSAPTMLGVHEAPVFDAEKKLLPLHALGLRFMSIGLLVDETRAMIWRGPMATGALRSMIDTRWGSQDDPLDVLVVDLPPGTGDVHLTLVQRLAVDGVVIVSTPQEIALVDARRAAIMFQKMPRPVPILGLIENMAYFPDPTTGAPIPIFGTGGARAEAERLGVPTLAEVPIDIAVREGGDTGRPIVLAQPDSIAAKAFVEAAKALL
jgi:ATP-binding protein involved in chromosome partitioning